MRSQRLPTIPMSERSQACHLPSNNRASFINLASLLLLIHSLKNEDVRTFIEPMCLYFILDRFYLTSIDPPVSLTLFFSPRARSCGFIIPSITSRCATPSLPVSSSGICLSKVPRLVFLIHLKT